MILLHFLNCMNVFTFLLNFQRNCVTDWVSRHLARNWTNLHILILIKLVKFVFIAATSLLCQRRPGTERKPIEDILRNMIIYTNEGNPLGLKLLLVAKFAKKDVQVKITTLNGENWELADYISQQNNVNGAAIIVWTLTFAPFHLEIDDASSS